MIIVGLGNPGVEYENTLHNMGYKVIDAIANKLGKKVNKLECSSLTSIVKNNPKIVLAKPLTYMNNSGEAVKSLLSKYKQEVSDLLVIYDDIDIDRFSVRVRKSGSAGTHNGMRSIIGHIGTGEFTRVRMGVGKGGYDLKDYVLSNIPKDDEKHFSESIEKIADLIIEYMGTGDVDRLLREGNVIK